MLNKDAVINASPFIVLSKSGLIDLLPQIFANVVMPSTVVDEILEGKDSAADFLRKVRQTWLQITQTERLEEISIWNLGDGETEVLSFANVRKDRSIALIDDRAARRCAETMGIPTLGTAGLLLVAKKEGLIRAVRPEIEKL